jgi:hypothetical protein
LKTQAKDDRQAIAELVLRLRNAITRGAAISAAIKCATDELRGLGYVYDSNKFPALQQHYDIIDPTKAAPTTLSEALLWKLGRWDAYLGFLEHFATDDDPGNGDIVFYAFAQHLRDRNTPIFDQHVLRAIWAIGNLTDEESKRCRSFLMDGNSEWKESGKGPEGVACYDLFLRRMSKLRELGASNSQLDKLLMPLGQALKDQTNNFADFLSLCGMPAAQ